MIHIQCDCEGEHPACTGDLPNRNTLEVTKKKELATCPFCREIMEEF